MKRTALLAVAAVLFFTVIFGACSKSKSGSSSAAKTITVKMTHTGSEQTLAHQSFLAIKDHMETASNGVFKVDIYPNGQLGNDAQLVEAVQEGDVQIMFTNVGYLVQFVPELGVFSVPFAFPNIDVAYKVLDGDFGKGMLDMMEGAGGMVGLSYIEAVAYRELSAPRSIRVPSDLAGLKIRVMTNPLHVAIWETLGAQPTAISFAELYTALQQGTVDAQENPVELFVSSRFYEVQKYLIMTNHVFQCGMLVANPVWFNGLTPELQRVVREAAMKGTLLQREKTAENYAEYLKTIQDSGGTIVELTDQEMQQWRDKARPVLPVFAQNVGGQAIIDRLFASVEAASR
ncbi:MAG: TRAP transporter substrate-binding protein [Treponema sp.]|jgi:tripartite ATP-independent transporter DctP family solute receptor|nr:TRAP transporter substrate-binding protein [Treponema sp.]